MRHLCDMYIAVPGRRPAGHRLTKRVRQLPGDCVLQAIGVCVLQAIVCVIVCVYASGDCVCVCVCV